MVQGLVVLVTGDVDEDPGAEFCRDKGVFLPLSPLLMVIRAGFRVAPMACPYVKRKMRIYSSEAGLRSRTVKNRELFDPHTPSQRRTQGRGPDREHTDYIRELRVIVYA
jgi:hypothetical protein